MNDIIQKQSRGYFVQGSGLLHRYTGQVKSFKRIFDTFNKDVVSNLNSKAKFIGLALGSAHQRLASKKGEEMSAQDKLFLVNYLNNNNNYNNNFESQDEDSDEDLENEPVQNRVEKKKVVSYSDFESPPSYISKNILY